MVISTILGAISLLARTLPRAWFVWLVTIVSATGTNLVDIIYGAEPGRHGIGPLQIASVIVRVFVGVLWTNVASSRAMIGGRSPTWAVNGDLWRAVGALILIEMITAPLFVVSAWLTRTRIAPLFPDAHVAAIFSLVAHDIFQFGFGMLTFKLTLWPIALAIGDRTVTLRVAWRRMRGAVWPLIGANILLIGPLFAAHVSLTHWAQSLTRERDLQLDVTLADGVLTGVQLILTFGLFNGLYQRLAADAVAKRAARDGRPDLEQDRLP